MHIHRDWRGLPAAARGATVAMGNFDGVHRGHRAVIDAARGARPDAPLGIVTFEPHPREYFAHLKGREELPFRLMNAEARANRLARYGVSQLYELPFGPTLASLTPEDFAREVLAEGLGVTHVAVGEDFRYGRGRAGDVRTLAEAGRRLGFGVTAVPLLEIDAAATSSTAIRAALAEGRPRDAERMLGHWHRIEGKVLHGAKRGRELGYPTANLAVDGLHLPKLGVYAVLVDVLDGPDKGNYRGVASLGVRPMFGENAPNLETYIFDFDGDLYGRHLSVALVDYLRPEARFEGLEALISQMRKDEDQARRILSAA
ncbi:MULTISPECIES: bifunctional riboflavin kinase/FAD synthetase [unclassified Paracoccus (in: a-proteobacteria)]|uniref:bifunctional riboflavin kinase/FAD synthetase n=1 Tax=unclassified Paracoccus (in: a-proteobacteria) TaxID=2688777 RepID=UPI0016039F83|nr:MULTISPECIES: bifunctional riboflavin kinase/FAD synthetase [unclassified Paracoccus (in: a-proteobacteria)]MBB1492219.1 bifunctional riboflavin kinase/FAD synthetase [Paracoccus sp. MC1854]MBB1498699.1 bifunctional riboflavin kinase/FAD synthetase [Paracoccus sp. MC1862]QQO46315.1 bifunctional riboflavin kinase/FAD synthetase [Paracoccus sp. MC1862]